MAESNDKNQKLEDMKKNGVLESLKHAIELAFKKVDAEDELDLGNWIRQTVENVNAPGVMFAHSGWWWKYNTTIDENETLRTDNRVLLKANRDIQAELSKLRFARDWKQKAEQQRKRKLEEMASEIEKEGDGTAEAAKHQGPFV